MFKHILFDLDGTLLPMSQDAFVQFYMPLLAKNFVRNGLLTDERGFLTAIWSGYEAMVKNDGAKTNREVFWEHLNQVFTLPSARAEQIAEAFYQDEFNQAVCTTQPTPTAAAIIGAAKEKGMEVYLATNPVFPRIATMNRIRWAGLNAEDFRIITTYETCRYCKPNTKYFEEIMKQFELNAAECLMVGNDVEEDLSIRELGVRTFLVTNTMENKKNLPVYSDYSGTLEDLLEFLKAL